MSDVSFPLEFSSKGRASLWCVVRPRGSIAAAARTTHTISSCSTTVLLLLVYVLLRSRGTGPLVLGGSALLVDEPASAGLRSNMLVIFREAEVAFFGCKGPRVWPWLTRCCFVSTALWTPSLGAELTVGVRHGDRCWRCFHDSKHAWV